MRIALLLAGLLLLQTSQASELVVGIEEANNSPFEYIDENAQLTGFHIEVIRAVSERLGWPLRFRRLPWKRAMRALEVGDLDAVSFVAQAPEREAFALFLPDNLLHVSGTALYIQRQRADSLVYQAPLDAWVRQWRTGLPSGYYMSDEVLELIAQGAPIEQPTVTQSQLFIMLISGRYDAVFGSTSALDRASSEIANLENQVQRLEGALFPGKPMYLAFSRKAPQPRAEQFAAAYRSFRQEPAYQQLAERFAVGELLPGPEKFH